MRKIAIALALGIPASAMAGSGAAMAMAADTASAANPQATAQKLYDAFAQGDMATIAALLGNDVNWVEAEGGPYEATNPHVGVQGVAAGVFGPVGATYADFKATPKRFTVQGDRVVVEGRYTGTHRESGGTLDAQFVHVFTVDGDRIVAMQQYTDTYQWRRLEGSLND